MPDNLKQSYENFYKAYLKLKEFLEEDSNTEITRAGIIHAYEFTFELFWKFLQKYLENLGILEEHGPSAVIKTGFQNGYLEQGQDYMDMLRDRNLIAHTYKEEMAKEIYTRIKNNHIYTLTKFIEKFEKVM